MENNWQHKTIERLEKQVWEDLADDTPLVRRAKDLRKTPLNEFSVEDLRFMISQHIGLDYLIPMALEQLTENILAEGDFYEGDLLKAVLTSPQGFWERNRNLLSRLRKLIGTQKSLLDQLGIDLPNLVDKNDNT